MSENQDTPKDEEQNGKFPSHEERRDKFLPDSREKKKNSQD